MTGPSKPDRDLALATTHGVSLHVDCAEELKRVIRIRAQYKGDSKIFLRVRPNKGSTSRFGMLPAQINAMIPYLRQHKVESVGFSFHINDYQVESRVQMLADCFAMAQLYVRLGIKVHGIDIGGGFPLRYVKSYYPENYLRGVHWASKPKIGTYPYSALLSGKEHAAEILRRAMSDSDVREFLTDQRIKIFLQPGRSLLDQCGITVFDVIDVKQHDPCQYIAVLDGMSFSLSETWFGSDFVPEPIILSCRDQQSPLTEHHYFLAGKSCLESDMLRSRAIGPGITLARGDLVAFTNTAGYQMDSNESTFHQHPLPQKISACMRNDEWQVIQDNRSEM